MSAGRNAELTGRWPICDPDLRSGTHPAASTAGSHPKCRTSRLTSRWDAGDLVFGPEAVDARLDRFGDLFLPVLGPGAPIPAEAGQRLLEPRA
jgi:hypothetical protein